MMVDKRIPKHSRLSYWLIHVCVVGNLNLCRSNVYPEFKSAFICCHGTRDALAGISVWFAQFEVKKFSFTKHKSHRHLPERLAHFFDAPAISYLILHRIMCFRKKIIPHVQVHLGLIFTGRTNWMLWRFQVCSDPEHFGRGIRIWSISPVPILDKKKQ